MSSPTKVIAERIKAAKKPEPKGPLWKGPEKDGITFSMLSRFLTDAEARDVISGLASGAVDVVIGTHRLLSGDIRFADLGLLVVDEEQ